MNSATESADADLELDRNDPLIASGDAAIERLPALRAIFQQMAVEFSQKLSNVANMPINFAITTMTARRIGEIQTSFAMLELSSVFRSNELDAKAIFAVDKAFVDSMTETLFGASFAEPSIEEPRSASRIEGKTTAFALDFLANSLQSSFAQVANVTFQPEAMQKTVDVSVLGRRNSIVIICACSLQAFGRAGQAIVVLPRSALDPYRAALSRNPATQGAAQDERWSAKLHDIVVQTEVKLSATMDRKGLTLADVLAFEVGQIIELPISPTSTIKFECENRTLFWCRLGQKDGHYTVRIEDFVDESDEFIQALLGD